MSSPIEKQITPRVNSALLANYVGRTVRLPCKLIKFNDSGRLTVEAADGGQVAVQVMNDDASLAVQYLEVVGKVTDPTSIQMLAGIDLGSDLDMKLVNDTIALIHDERFFSKMFSY